MYYTTTVRWMDYLDKGKVLTNTDLNKFVNKISEKYSFYVHRKSLGRHGGKVASTAASTLATL